MVMVSYQMSLKYTKYDLTHLGASPSFDPANFIAEMVPYLSTITWEDVLKPRIKALLNHLESIGNVKTAIIGYCWGGWVLSLAVSDPEVYNSTIKVGVIPHPSIHLENFLFKRDAKALIESGNVPVLWMPAGNDIPPYLPDGEWYLALKAHQPASNCIHFSTMTHGFAVRGDRKDPETAKAIDECLNQALSFIKVNM